MFRPDKTVCCADQSKTSWSKKGQVETEIVDQLELDLIDIALQTAHLAKKGNAAMSSAKRSRVVTAKRAPMADCHFDIAASEWRFSSSKGEGEEVSNSQSSKTSIFPGRSESPSSLRQSCVHGSTACQDLLAEFEEFSRKRSRREVGHEGASRSRQGQRSKRQDIEKAGIGGELVEGSSSSLARRGNVEILNIQHWNASAKTQFALTREWL
eukprot:753161-Hanusia_phi.AAC.5